MSDPTISHALQALWFLQYPVIEHQSACQTGYRQRHGDVRLVWFPVS